MANYTIHFYGVHFSNGKQFVNNWDLDEVIEPISAQEYNDLVTSDCDTFYDVFSTVRKRVEQRFEMKLEYVSDWEVQAVGRR